jgi:hypothetical protein
MTSFVGVAMPCSLVEYYVKAGEVTGYFRDVASKEILI